MWGTHVGTELEVARSALDVLVVWVVGVTVHNLLGEGEWPLEPFAGGERRVWRGKRRAQLPLADDGEVILDALVVDKPVLLQEGHCDFGVADAAVNGGRKTLLARGGEAAQGGFGGLRKHGCAYDYRRRRTSRREGGRVMVEDERQVVLRRNPDILTCAMRRQQPIVSRA